MKKTYQVTESNGAVHTIVCDFLFNNSGELSLRAGEKGSTAIVGLFPAGSWTSCVKIVKPKEPADG